LIIRRTCSNYQQFCPSSFNIIIGVPVLQKRYASWSMSRDWSYSISHIENQTMLPFLQTWQMNIHLTIHDWQHHTWWRLKNVDTSICVIILQCFECIVNYSAWLVNIHVHRYMVYHSREFEFWKKFTNIRVQRMKQTVLVNSWIDFNYIQQNTKAVVLVHCTCLKSAPDNNKACRTCIQYVEETVTRNFTSNSSIYLHPSNP
jgi:hypothetical protein